MAGDDSGLGSHEALSSYNANYPSMRGVEPVSDVMAAIHGLFLRIMYFSHVQVACSRVVPVETTVMLTSLSLQC